MTTPPITRPTDVLDKRTHACSALIEAAEPNLITRFLVGQELGVPLVGGLVTGKIFTWSKALSGGLWIPGAAYLEPNAVSFHPDAFYKLGYKNLESICIPLAEVAAVRATRKMLAPAIAVETGDAVLWLRVMWKAKSFADAIENARAAAYAT